MKRSTSTRSVKKAFGTVAKHAFLIVMSVISIYPVLWVVAIAFTSGETLLSPKL